jgi:hypothetical protein
MTLAEQERQSTRAVSELLCYASDERGYARIVGEVARTTAPQALYLNESKAQTMHSQSMNRRAVDVHLFIDGPDQLSGEAYTPLADDEVRLDPEHHVWGGHGTTLWDDEVMSYPSSTG